MKINAASRPLQSAVAFTLTEMLVSMALFSMVITSVIYTHMMGVKLYELAKSKLGAGDQARGALSLLITEIRAARDIAIGTGSSSTFTEIAAGTLQKGNSIQIYNSVTNTNNYVRYFLDSSAQKLIRMRSGSSSQDMIAQYITNTTPFTAEDYRGTNLSANQGNRVIGINLQFYQIQYPVVKIGPGQYYDSYQINVKVTRRALE